MVETVDSEEGANLVDSDGDVMPGLGGASPFSSEFESSISDEEFEKINIPTEAYTAGLEESLNGHLHAAEAESLLAKKIKEEQEALSETVKLESMVKEMEQEFMQPTVGFQLRFFSILVSSGFSLTTRSPERIVAHSAIQPRIVSIPIRYTPHRG